jgi:hypothetical protein
MPKKDADDPNLFAKSVLDQIIAKHDPEAIREQGKNPHAVALGLRSGSKGGHARAKSTTAKQRQKIAKDAVTARWNKREKSAKSSKTAKSAKNP